MRSPHASRIAGNVGGCGIAALISASLMTEIKLQDGRQPEIDVFDLRDALTGKDVDINAEELAKNLDYWAAEVAKYRSPTAKDVEIYAQLFRLNTEYEIAQNQSRIAAQNLAACQKAAGGASKSEVALKAALLSEQRTLADKIAKIMQGDSWTLESIKDDYMRMIEICKAVSLPKLVEIDSKELLVAHLRTLQAREQLVGIQTKALQLLHSEEGLELNNVFPKDREEICNQLNIEDPTRKVHQHVRYLLENSNQMDAYILAENRQRKRIEKQVKK